MTGGNIGTGGSIGIGGNIGIIGINGNIKTTLLTQTDYKANCDVCYRRVKSMRHSYIKNNERCSNQQVLILT